MAGVGLYLGSTSACVALHKSGRVELLTDDTGSRTTPTCVALIGGEILVGLPAKQRLVRNPESCVCDIKQLIGKQHSQLQSISTLLVSRLKQKNENVVIELKSDDKVKQFGVIDLATAVFKKLRDTAVSGGCNPNISIPATLAAPSYFTSDQKQEIRMIAESAGFSILRIVSEPAAAALAYDIGQRGTENDSCYSLVYHLGGRSLDVTVFECINGMYRALASKHIPDLGGQQFDDVLVGHFQREFHRSFRVELENGSRGIRKLKSAVENTKKILSTMNQATISVESLHEGMDFQSTITRARFEDICAAVFTSCVQPVDDVLKTADLEKSLIDNVVLSGGASRMPRIRQLLEQALPKAEMLDRINPDEVIAQGAAVQVGILLDAQPNDLSVDSTTQLDCVARPLVAVIAGTDGMSKVITVIPKLTPLPFSKSLNLDLSSELKGEPTAVLLYESDSSSTLVGEHLVGEILLSPESRNGQAPCLKLLIELTRQQGFSIRVCNQSTEEPVELRIPVSE